jgi:hypothetical protein
MEDDTLTISLDDYHVGDSISNITLDTITDVTGSAITIDNVTITIDNNTYPYTNVLDNSIDPDDIERMCKEYPSLEKVWRNFKSVYDMVKQDYEGKKKSGEIDDDIPF